MISHTAADFQSCYEILSPYLRLLARKQYLFGNPIPFTPPCNLKKQVLTFSHVELMMDAEPLPHRFQMTMSGFGLDLTITI